MNPCPSFFLTALSALCLLLPCKGQEAATASPHPIFEHWHTVLMGQCTPEGLFADPGEREEMQEEIESEVATAQERAAASLEAAKRLYLARLELLSEFMNAPCCQSEREASPARSSACREWLAEGFRRDLEALSGSGSWLKPGLVEPGSYSGRVDELFCPVLNKLAFAQVNGCQAEISYRYEELNDEWRGMQGRFMSRLRSWYGEGEEAGGRDPFSGRMWWREEEETAHYCEKMQRLIDREQQAWQQYLTAMGELVAPCPSYYGSGTGITISIYERTLLDTRERFLCLLAAGAEGLARWPHISPERHAVFQTLHPEHRFGEVFTSEATLFRHPKLEGQPWCLRFDYYGPGFIFVQNNEQLRRFASERPEGGRATVHGCQKIEGDPPQQVFVLQGYDPTQS